VSNRQRPSGCSMRKTFTGKVSFDQSSAK